MPRKCTRSGSANQGCLHKRSELVLAMVLEALESMYISRTQRNYFRGCYIRGRSLDLASTLFQPSLVHQRAPSTRSLV